MTKQGIVVPGRTPPANSEGQSDTVKKAGAVAGEAWDSTVQEKKLEQSGASSQSDETSQPKP